MVRSSKWDALLINSPFTYLGLNLYSNYYVLGNLSNEFIKEY
jgi:hypothetical protein